MKPLGFLDTHWDETKHVLVLNVVVPLLTAALLWLGGRKSWIKWAVLWSGLMLSLCLLDIFSPPSWQQTISRWLFLPMAIQITWNLFVAPLWSVFATLWLGWIALTRWRATRPQKKRAVATPPPVSAKENSSGLSRREFINISLATAAPIGAIALGFYCDGTNEFLRLRRFDIAVQNLPTELEGLTIAHVSDLHSGRFCGPERLKVMSDLVNHLKADMVAVTGDLINLSPTELPHAMEALVRLKAPLGVHLCQGNHDLNVPLEVIQRECLQNGLHFHYSSHEIIDIKGYRLVVGGVPWKEVHSERHDEFVQNCFPPKKEGDVRILLAHHPHFFDSADSTDLVLSGHTHGGQIMMGDFGLGSIAFRYWSGKYEREATTLVVSNGCGDWFPCRIGAPAEVGLLTLHRA